MNQLNTFDQNFLKQENLINQFINYIIKILYRKVNINSFYLNGNCFEKANLNMKYTAKYSHSAYREDKLFHIQEIQRKKKYIFFELSNFPSSSEKYGSRGKCTPEKATKF